LWEISVCLLIIFYFFFPPRVSDYQKRSEQKVIAVARGVKVRRRNKNKKTDDLKLPCAGIRLQTLERHWKKQRLDPAQGSLRCY